MQTGVISYCNQDIHYDFFWSGSSTADPVLLLGGVLQNRKSWKSYINDLAPFCPVLVIDLPGIGDSGILDASYDFGFLSDCIYVVMQQLGIPRVSIFSTSYSSIIAYEFSEKFTGSINKLVISSSMTSLPVKQKQIMSDCIAALQDNDLVAFYNLFVDGVCSSDTSVQNYNLSRKVIRTLISALSREDVAQFIQNTKRVLQYKIPQPTVKGIELSPLIFTGEHDTFTPPELCRQIGNYYKDSYFGTIKHYDHLFHIGNRRTIIQYILPFFVEEKIPAFARIRQHSFHRESPA